MPVLAIPYVVPFATYAGIAIGSVATAVGLSALSDKVQDYMEEFPEESMKILAMIMPEQGIAALFNKEAGDEVEGEEIIDLDEDETKLSGKEKGKRMKEEAQKKPSTGSYQDKEGKATGSFASKRGRMIRRAEELGLADPKLKDKPYDKSKKYQGWKRFVRKKADGGRIGFEVGGLSEQAQSIYDSWIAAGHTEEDVLAYLTSRGLYGGDEATGIETIVNTAPGITQGGDGDYKGGGKWGNLDLSKTKTFNKNVFKTEGPVKGWDMTEIEGFYNPKIGNYQTWEGQNIEHGGYFTGDPEEGDIEGTPIDWSGIPMGAWGLGMKAFKGIQNAWQKKQAEGILEAAADRQEKSKLAHELKLAADAKAALAASYTGPPTSDWNPIQHEKSGGGNYTGAGRQAPGSAASGPQGGPAYGPWKADGGLATMFERRR